MQDHEIIALYEERNEKAISESDAKYGAHCRRIAEGILGNTSDGEECVSDTWLRAWNSIPPAKPAKLGAYFFRIVRNLAFDRHEKRNAAKRGGEITLILDELAVCTEGSDFSSALVDSIVLGKLLNTFVGSLSVQSRRIFVLRYFHCYSVAEIAKAVRLSESGVKMSLSRRRTELKELLQKEGYEYE